MKIKRVIAFVIGTIMIAGLLIGYCSFYGNPIQKIMVNLKVDDYLKSHFTELDYERSEVGYNFKDGSYHVFMNVKDSEDKDFTISYLKGKIKNDYQFRVIERENTSSRLQVYLNKTTWEDTITHLFGDNLNFSFLTYNQKACEENKPELDIPLEKLLIDYPLELSVYIYDKTQYSEEEIIKLKELVKKEYGKLNIKLSSIEITD